MAEVEIRPYDVVDYLRNDEDLAAYLEAALEATIDEGEPMWVTIALGNIARAKGGMSKLARETGLSREHLYRALSEAGNPEFATVLKVVKALGLQLQVKPASAPTQTPSA